MQAFSLPFPAFAVNSRAEFERYILGHAELLRHRNAYEETLRLHADVRLCGICPLTLAPTVFTSKVDKGLIDRPSTSVPDWRNSQVCSNGVHMADRALVHFAADGERRLGDVALLSENAGLPSVLKTLGMAIRALDLHRLGEGAGGDTLLVNNLLELGADLNANLSALYRRTNRGGVAYFHFNFHCFEAESRWNAQETGGRWLIGWDIRDRMRDAGFRTSEAVTFWSRELGYLGPFNFIFSAQK